MTIRVKIRVLDVSEKSCLRKSLEATNEGASQQPNNLHYFHTAMNTLRARNSKAKPYTIFLLISSIIISPTHKLTEGRAPAGVGL